MKILKKLARYILREELREQEEEYRLLKLGKFKLRKKYLKLRKDSFY